MISKVSSLELPSHYTNATATIVSDERPAIPAGEGEFLGSIAGFGTLGHTHLPFGQGDGVGWGASQPYPISRLVVLQGISPALWRQNRRS